MKIPNAEFNKLEQLDRIEYRQIANEIEKIYTWPKMDFLILEIMLMISGLIFISLNKFNSAILIIKVSIIVILMDLVGMLIVMALENKMQNKLDEKYFKIIKKNDRKRIKNKY